MKTLTETDIQRAICDYLAAKRYFFWRQNTAPTFDWKTNQFRRMPKYSIKGVPDIILIDGGHFVGIEVKKAKGTQSEHQKKFQRQLEDAGGSYYLVKSVDDVIAIGL